MRIVFMGTGDIAIPSFLSLLPRPPLALVTQPDKPVGRKQVMTAPRIKTVALEHGICVLQPEKAGDQAFLDELKALKPDVIVVMAYGQILKQALLDLPRVAIINVHASLLPKYRGAACIQAAIDAGDATTGVTVMHVVKALDAGDVILRREIEIGADETGGVLHDRLADLSPMALAEALKQIADASAGREPQDESQVSYIPKLMRQDGEIDWNQSAAKIERRVRAYDPWPGTSTAYIETKGRHRGRLRRLKVYPQVRLVEGAGAPGEVLECEGRLVVACGEGALEIQELQADGSRRMSAAEFLLGGALQAGDVLQSGGSPK
ncbi:methionyl-tRNA formyltransferase [Verrucomicrobiaceae bacterium N1E253]|uniref:Methionyl-tRNA formyltransferase n=1 Tax=Oceaniferula marina TaxID=2748318 RepID=A0A851GRZ9_9BACT|nr:methionyl-tRNA formyltransferase [Oceaniferula marina]